MSAMVVVVAIISIASEINSILKGAAFAEKKISFYICRTFKEIIFRTKIIQQCKKELCGKKISIDVTLIRGIAVL